MARRPGRASADGAGGGAADRGRGLSRPASADRDRLGGLVRPVHYARNRDSYRPPPELYGWLSRRLGPAATACGLAPGDVITLEVPGRRTGVIRRTTMVRAACNGSRYVVALAGESDWVRNVRAAGGRVVIGGRQRRARAAGRGAASGAGDGHPRVPAEVGQAARFAGGGP